MVNGVRKDTEEQPQKNCKQRQRWVSLALSANWGEEGGYEKTRGDPRTGWTWLRKSAGARGTEGGQGSSAVQALLGMPLSLVLDWVSVGGRQTHLEGMSTHSAALQPKILIQQVWWEAQESAFPESFQVMLAWGPCFENHNFLFSPSGHFMFKPENTFTP